MQFTKLFNSILDSTIWQESKETKLVWITMLAMCDKHGEIHASIPGLAVRAGVSVDECETALKCMLSPDKYSRTKDSDGRRITEIDGGWRLINHGKYRALLSIEERREYLRQKQAEHRAKNVNNRQQKSTMSTHTEADTDTDTNKVSKDTLVQKTKTKFQKPSIEELTTYWSELNLKGDSAEFYDHFEANGWRVGAAARMMHDWRATARNWSRRDGKFGTSNGKPKHKTVKELMGDNYAGE